MKKAKFIILGVIILIFAGLWLYWNADKSDGSRAGTLSKLSNKGILFKTNEGELYMSMFIGEQAAASGATNTWAFSVDKSDPELMKKLESFVGNGKRVQLFYKEKFVTLPWRGDTPYIVYKAEATQ
ncbi:MAG: hypothetical protein MUF42_08730 [Cytophagaceae bacterium]|jgi:hypothetical protein|nr:hypothetical protein [Cytophagaceae bacterium]